MTSEIRANTLKNRVGLGTVSFTNTGPVVSGIVTANGIRLADNNKIQLGDGQDIEVYHDGSYSYLQAQGTLFIDANGDINLRNPNNGEYKAAFNNNGACSLMHNGQVKFATTSTGINVTGSITGTGDFTLTDTATDSSAGPEFKLFRNSASPADADYLGQIKFAGESDTGVERNYAKITGKILDASNGTEDGIIEFAHIKAGSQTITGRWRSDSLQLLNSTNFSVAGTSEFTGDATFNGGAGAVTIPANSDMRFINGTWSGDVSGNIAKIQHHSNILYISGGSSGIYFRENNTNRWFISDAGHFISGADSTYDIGTSGNKVRNGYFDTLYGDGSNLTGIVGVTINNNTDNRVATCTGTTGTLNGEANLTFNGSTLDVLGNTDGNVQASFTRANDPNFRIQFRNESSNNGVGYSQGKFGLFYNSNSADICGMQFLRGSSTGAGALMFTTGGTERLSIKSDGELVINHTQTSSSLNNTFISIWDANSDSSAIDASGVSKNYAMISLHNYGTGIQGDTTGIGFGAGSGFSYTKGSVAFQRTGSYGTGDLVFLTNNDQNTTMVNEGDERMRITKEGDIYGPGGGRKNWFDNGSFDCTYGGRKANTSMDYGNHHAYGWVTDRWMSRNSVQWSRSTNVPAGKGFSYSTLTNGSGGQLVQAVELPDYGDMGVFTPGSYWCVSFWSTATCNPSGAAFSYDLGSTKTDIPVAMSGAYTSTGETAAGTSTGTFTRYYKVFGPMPSSIISGATGAYWKWGFSQQGYTTGFQLERVPTSTSKPTPYEHVHPSVTIARCRRYCYRVYNSRHVNGWKRHDANVNWEARHPVLPTHMPSGSNQSVDPYGITMHTAGKLTNFQSIWQNPAVSALYRYGFNPADGSFILYGTSAYSGTHLVIPSYEDFEYEVGHGFF